MAEFQDGWTDRWKGRKEGGKSLLVFLPISARTDLRQDLGATQTFSSLPGEVGRSLRTRTGKSEWQLSGGPRTTLQPFPSLWVSPLSPLFSVVCVRILEWKKAHVEPKKTFTSVLPEKAKAPTSGRSDDVT